MRYFLYSLSAVVVLLVPLLFINAQIPCGNIIVPEDTYEVDSPLVTTPVTDCDNPFGENSFNDVARYSFSIDGVPVTEGATIQVPQGGTAEYQFEDIYVAYASLHPQLFLHDGNDYRYVSLEPSQISGDDYRQSGIELSLSMATIELYVQVFEGTYDYSDLDVSDQDGYDALEEYVIEHFVSVVPKIEAGTYTLVTEESIVYMSQQNIFQKLFALLISTAHAQFAPNNIYTLTFTVEEIPTIKECCSSVVFLPGIKGSVLKKEGAFGTEDILWPPTIYADDVDQLALTEGGESTEDVYVDGILDSFHGTPIYSSFSSFMDTLVVDETIKNWQPLPYDWRFGPEKILQDGVKTSDGVVSIIDEIKTLAADSDTGQVTIVAHSMGGLMGKAIIEKLQQEGKDNLIDSFVMVGSPQLGTPQAITAMLHGEGESILAGRLINAATTRLIVQNMQSSYNLLPSVRYFEEVTDPIVTFRGNDWYTTDWINQWGTKLDTYTKYIEFLTGQGVPRDNPGLRELSKPVTLRADLVSSAKVFHNEYDDYIFPSHIRVVQVAGWGISTIKSVLYRSRHLVFPTYEPNFTAEGDGTVVYPSALSSEGEEYFINLDLYQKQNSSEFDHKDLLSVDSVQKVVSKIIKEEIVSSIDFITDTKPNPTSIDAKLLVSSHSPVLLGVFDDAGRFTGINYDMDENPYLRISEDIPGSSFREFGDSQYIFLPKTGSYSFSYKGIDNGPTTIEIETFSNDVRALVAAYTDIPTTQTTLAKFELNSFEPENTQIYIDSNGDGVTDSAIRADGAELSLDELMVVLETTVNSLNLQKKFKKRLEAKVKILKKILQIRNQRVRQFVADINLNIIKHEVDLLRKKNKISNEEAVQILELLTKIKEKI